MKQKRPIIFTATLLVALASFGLFMAAVVFGWMGPSKDVGGAFCEAARPGLIKQPANTWSNIGFITAGLVMAWQLMRGVFNQNSNPFTRTTFTPIFFSSLAVLLGPGSMAMHATETHTGGALDMLSMYLIAAFTTSYAFQRFFKWGAWQFTLVFVAVIAVCEWAGTIHGYIPFIHYAGNLAFAIFITITVVVEALNSFVRKLAHEQKYGLYSLASIVLAFIIWQNWLDGSPLCDPGSLIQGHAMWHLLDALSVYFLFRFYVSEHHE